MAAEYALLAVAVVAVLALATTAVVGLGYVLSIAYSLFTIPGVVVHEFAHKQACDLAGVPVLEAVYFRFGDPPGYVRHHQPDRYRTSFVISVAPFLVNTAVALAAFLGLAALVSATGHGGTSPSDWLEAVETVSRETLAAGLLLAWLGFSVGMHAFPSTGDARTLWTRSRAEWRRSPVVLLGIPVVVVIYIANLLSWLWADVFYALALALAAFAVVGLV